MKTFPVDVQADHIKRLASVTGRPLAGVLELVWNAFDADATSVSVSFETNDLGGLDRIVVSDNGTGIDPLHVETYFGSLGGSWKQATRRTSTKRVLHGSQGKGRFKAFGLGGRVEWTTTFGSPLVRYKVIGTDANIKNFGMSDVTPAPQEAVAGTEVAIENMHGDFPSLRGNDALQNVTEAVAIYLEQYPGVTLSYDGRVVDPASVQDQRAELAVGPVDVDGRALSAEVLIIEWLSPATRKLYLCDDEGCTLGEVPPGIRAPGHNFTAYLKSSHVRSLEEGNLLSLAEMDTGLMALVDAAKEKLADHFAQRDAQKAADKIRRWQEEQVYPYAGAVAGPVEQAEREVFEVVALSIDKRLTEFDARDVKSRRLTFRLIRQALEESPEALSRILTEVLDLPLHVREEFAALLQRTSLSKIINASKVVGDRLAFIAGLNTLLFDPDVSKVLKERKQLHRILAKETWVFGEEHNLMVDDKGLSEVLRQVLDAEGLNTHLDEPVTTETGYAGIVDLMFGCARKHWGATGREYLVVELKRPKVKIDNAALQQCYKYAEALSKHAKFASTNTRWDFWALSNELDEFARKQTSQPHRPRGLYMDDPEGRYRIWALDWGTLLREAESRHQFFKDQLDIEVQAEDARAYLRKAHEKHLPKAVLKAV